MTREKFVGNPFEAGKRMYKTGDVGRWLEDGNLQYLGRKTDGKISETKISSAQVIEKVVWQESSRDGSYEKVTF